MLEHRAVAKRLIFVLLAGLMVGSAVDAKPTRKSRTVGDLLKRIEKKANKVSLKKSQGKLPGYKSIGKSRARVDLQSVKPPSTANLYYPEGTKDANLEKATDKGISQLYKLSKQFKNSPRRGEIWLRLAELYVEKARLIEFKLSQDFEAKMKEYIDKKRSKRPELNLEPAQAYNKKAIQLYKWFIRDYPKDEKVDQALFFLGYNYFELGQSKTGSQYYSQLTKKFPRSFYNEEAAFALGEYYFENEKYKTALPYYHKVAKNRRGRLFSFSMYKLAWTQYKLGQMSSALRSLEKVIRAGKEKGGSSGPSRLRLASEASKDLVVFYAEAGKPENARRYFDELVGAKKGRELIEKLAYFYADSGNRKAAQEIFSSLIDENPQSEKAFEYQYQIVSLYATSSTSNEFRGELFEWLNNYGPGSQWQKSNDDKRELVQKVNQLMESTLRNHILQIHQTAQNSRTKYSQNKAKDAYQLYFKKFDSGEKIDEMHFFFAELLFDMGEFEGAAYHYNWIVKNAPKSQYAEKSRLNTVLALEKALPSEKDLKDRLGDSLDPVPLEKNVKNFLLASKQYEETYPKGENVPAIKYKAGALYYYHNMFDEALNEFNEIIKGYPKSDYAKNAANLTLDIYNLKKDFVGLEKAGTEILKNEDLASGQVGTQVKSVLQQVSFKKAQDLESEKKYQESAESFKAFADQNPGSDLAITALFNAGLNFERAGLLAQSANMHESVVKKGGKAAIKEKSEKILPSLYEKVGRYKEAASMMENYGSKNPKEKEAIDYLFNAAVIQDGVRRYRSAAKNYQEYFDRSRSDDKYDTLFLLAKLWEQRGGISKASEYYGRFYTSPTKDKSAVVESAFRNAEIFRKKRKNSEYERWLKKTVASQEALSKNSKSVGVRFAAEAQFDLVKGRFEELTKVKIPANPAKQKSAVDKKLSLLNKLKDDLKSVIAYDDGPTVVASLTLLGQAYQHMAAAIFGAPTPKGLDEEGLKQYKEGVRGIAAPFEKEAIANYKSAIERGFALKGYSEWLIRAHHELFQLDPSQLSYKEEQAAVSSEWDSTSKLLSKDEYKDLKFAVDSNSEANTVREASKLLGKNTEDLGALMALATIHHAKNEPGLSEIILTRALKSSPNEPAIFHNLGIIYLERGDLREALASFEKANELDSKHLPTVQSLASIYLKYFDYKRAYEILKPMKSKIYEGLSRSTTHQLEMANGLGVASANVGENDEALSNYDKVLKVDGQNTSVLLNKTILLAERIKSKDKATEVLNKLKFLADDRDMQQKVRYLEGQISQLKD